MKVFIYRHAEAEQAEPDEGRRLTDRGRQQIQRLAALVPEKEFTEVSEIWHSPLVRARQTASDFRKHVGILEDVGLHKVHELEPYADVYEMAKLLAQCEGDVIACGHNPFLEELVTCLCVGEPGMGLVTLKKGGMVCLERTNEATDKLPVGFWSILWYVVPRLCPSK